MLGRRFSLALSNACCSLDSFLGKGVWRKLERFILRRSGRWHLEQAISSRGRAEELLIELCTDCLLEFILRFVPIVVQLFDPVYGISWHGEDLVCLFATISDLALCSLVIVKDFPSESLIERLHSSACVFRCRSHRYTERIVLLTILSLLFLSRLRRFNLDVLNLKVFFANRSLVKRVHPQATSRFIYPDRGVHIDWFTFFKGW